MEHSMRVLIVYNFEGCKLGLVGTALNEVDAQIDLVRAHLGEPLPDGPEDHDAIVVLGGVQDALDDATCAWMPHLSSLMRSFVETDRSVLGVCLGSQLLARAYGGHNIIGGASEFGWRQVDLTPEGISDPVFSGTAPSFPIFQWHDDTFTLPRRAVRLASSVDVQNQAFRIGRAGYAMQFHFEADCSVVSAWNLEFSSWLAENRPGWTERHAIEAGSLGATADATGIDIARNWVGTIARRT
jgi:GMP synthase-like glutamine amidotransferase